MADRVAVVGQGYVGLPVALAAASSGMAVVGLDVDAARVAQLNAGNSPVKDVADPELRDALASGRYAASADFAAVADADVVVLCVPTPYVGGGPDVSHIESAAAAVGPHLRPGALVVLESTTYPGTTEELLRPILERASGLTAGADDGFGLAFSPERIDPANARYGLRNTPKLVGGLTARDTERAVAFYERFVDAVVPVRDARTAETAKLLENTFRHINIALANEMAVICHDLGVDVWEVIEAAATKPFGFMPFYPGPGVGGHCIPVDPLYLSWRVRQFGGAAKFVDLARDVNATMPAYCVTRVQDLLNDQGKAIKGADVLLLGVTYKRDIPDMREAPALPLIDGLHDKGAVVAYHDPYIPAVQTRTGRRESVPLTAERLASADCVVVVTDHSDVDYELVAARAPLVFDTRNAVGVRAPHVHRL